MELPAKYPPEHYQQKARHYELALRYGFGVKLDTPTKERLKDLTALGRGIDTYLDEGGDKDTLIDRTQDIEQLLEQPSVVGELFPALGPDQLDEETYARLRGFGRAILHVNLHFKTTEDLAEYITYRKVEGKLYAELISSVATPEVASQPGYRRFSRWLRPIGEVTNLLNSFHGIKREYDNGEIAYKPGYSTHLRLLGHIALSSVLARHTAYSEVLDVPYGR